MSESETKTIKEYRSNTAVKTLYDWLEMFAYALAVVLLILTFGARHSPVKGTSMLDTLHDADILIVSSGLFYKPKAGDIVVFQTKTGGYN
jgi:signal peptidase I